MNTWVNCERDACVTGDGPVHIDGYSFVHQVFGQIPAVTQVLRPSGIAASLGFAKRFSIGFFGISRAEPDQQCDASKALLFDFHDWMGEHASSVASYSCLDPFAETLFSVVLDSVKRFVEETQDLDELFAQKLGFADTDLLRFTNVGMRMVQFLEKRTAFRMGAAPSSCQAYTVYELAHAIHCWRRQLVWHRALYRVDPESLNTASLRLHRAGTLQLSEEEFCQAEILAHPSFRGVVATTAQLRVMVRRNLVSRGIADQAACIAAAAATLVSLEILREVADGTQPARGPRVRRFAKRPWSEIQSNTISVRHLERLGVGVDAFL